MTLKKKNIINVIKLKKMFGPYASDLEAMKFVEPLPRSKRGEIRPYKIRKPLPSNEEFQQLLRDRYTFTVQEIISDAFEEFMFLSAELDDWYNNLPEGLKNSNKGSMLQDARYIFENLNEEPEISEKLGNLKIVSLPALMPWSPSAPCAAACIGLNDVIELLEDENEISARLKDDEEVDKLISEAEEVACELRNILYEAEIVELPDMDLSGGNCTGIGLGLT
ncbi:MAG: hypothetical protein JXA73_22855 [Acidobacteria bacterium]|nr:hypothetical protein [Acidobacteriota bacterium]